MCHTTKAFSFDQAKEQFENQPFDIAILDIMGVDGYELLEIAVKKNVTALMVTARALSPKHTVTSFRKGLPFSFPKRRWARLKSSSTMFWKRKKRDITRGIDGWRD